MKISVILAHPDPKSFNRAIAQTVVEQLKTNEHSVQFHDLYEENFEALLHRQEIRQEATLPPGVRRHCLEIAEAEGIIIIHPNWWGQPPAILKGWIDRVIRPGIAYEFLEGDSGEGIPQGLLPRPGRNGFQHIKHRPGKRKGRFWRPPGNNLEELRFRALWRPYFLPQDFQCDHYQHAVATKVMA